ncbi:MAG TPA: DUF4296 domain-containing protein [Saprospiraceae bacterium]|nr:DUF4296 domain-containing protein [Saprospiraceae bacterium]
MKIKKIIQDLPLWFLFCCLLMGCYNHASKISWDEDKAVDILVDLRLIDNQVKRHHHLHRDSVREEFLNLILKIHGISKEELENNMKIIQSDAHKMKALEDKVYDRLNATMKELGNDKN